MRDFLFLKIPVYIYIYTATRVCGVAIKLIPTFSFFICFSLYKQFVRVINARHLTSFYHQIWQTFVSPTEAPGFEGPEVLAGISKRGRAPFEKNIIYKNGFLRTESLKTIRQDIFILSIKINFVNIFCNKKFAARHLSTIE